jgi:hypothetical protein
MLEEKYKELATKKRVYLDTFAEEVGTRTVLDKNGLLVPKVHESYNTKCAVDDVDLRYNILFPSDERLRWILSECSKKTSAKIIIKRMIDDWNAYMQEDEFKLKYEMQISSDLQQCAKSTTDIPDRYLARIEVKWEPTILPREVSNIFCVFKSESELKKISKMCQNDVACSNCNEIEKTLVRIKNEVILGGERSADLSMFQDRIRSLLITSLTDRKQAVCVWNALARLPDYLTQQ